MYRGEYITVWELMALSEEEMNLIANGEEDDMSKIGDKVIDIMEQTGKTVGEITNEDL